MTRTEQVINYALYGILSVRLKGTQIMKWLLRAESFASYSLDRFAARPWNQSSWSSEEGRLIPVEAQVVKPAEGFTVSCKLFTEVCQNLGFCYCKEIFLESVPKAQEHFCLTKLFLPFSVVVGWIKWKEKKTNKNKQQLQIAFLFR